MSSAHAELQHSAPGGPAGAVPWSHVSFLPPPAWVDLAAFARDLPAKEGAHVTYLLWERQVHVEAETSFHATAIRLETAAAVQHQSQWRLNLDPRAHHLTLHWLRVVRGDQTFDHLHRERMRLIQRETQLEHLVIDGQWTLLVVLDDVRPGDTIEAGYSYTGRHPIRPGGCEAFFVVPPAIVVGRFRLRLEFPRSLSNLGWLASPDAPVRKEEELPDGRVRWTWEGAQNQLRDPEPNQPSTFLDYLWVQVSDLPEWQPLAARLAEVWSEAVDDTDLAQFPGFAAPAEVNEAAVHQLVQSIQEHYRYLSVDLENGGWIPMLPSVVARRRYGDCKDLAWLATCVLRRWGVRARPILVGTGLRERVEVLRPMSLLFNHALLEVEINGKARWFDLTLRHQGGDFTSQPVSQYGRGLPVDAESRSLAAQPGSVAPSIYALRETILLDTRRGQPSLVEVRLWTEGWHAETQRRNRVAQGPEEFAKERLANMQRRYGKAERVGSLQWRDDRGRNVCEIVESFTVRDVVYASENGERALFDVPPNLIAQSFLMPEEKPRRAPWDMPNAIEVRHEVTIKGRSMGAGTHQRYRWAEPEFSATLDEPRKAGAWTKTVRFAVNAEEIAADRLTVYRRQLDEILRATSWRIFMPWNEARPEQGENSSILPPSSEGVTAYVPPADETVFRHAVRKPIEENPRTITHGPAVFRPSTDTDWSSGLRFAIPALILLSMLLRNCSG